MQYSYWMSFFCGTFCLLSLNSLLFNMLVSVPATEVHPPIPKHTCNPQRGFHFMCRNIHLTSCGSQGNSLRSSFQMQCQVYNKHNNCTVYRIYFITILVIAAIVNKSAPCHRFILFFRKKDRFASFVCNYNNEQYIFVFSFL